MMFGALPTMPWRVGHYPSAPNGLGLGALGAETFAAQWGAAPGATATTAGRGLIDAISGDAAATGRGLIDAISGALAPAAARRSSGGGGDDGDCDSWCRGQGTPCGRRSYPGPTSYSTCDCTVCLPSAGGGGGGGGDDDDQPPSGALAPDTTWTKCADEGGVCDWAGEGEADVRYGAGDRWTEKLDLLDKVDCKNHVFGDPTSGKKKACYYKITGPAFPLPSTPVPPAAGSAPPTPVQVCNAPSNVTLGYAERWVEVDPIQCLWQIIRTTTAGQPQVLPQVYGGTPVIEIPQSAEPGETPLSPGAVGLYQPSWQLPGGGFGGGAGELSATAILQAAVDVLGRGLTPEEMTEVTGKRFTNIAELYTYLREELGTGDADGGGDGGGIGVGWLSENPYLALGVAAVGLWFLFGRKR